jgi:hypothetical protein
MLIAYYSHAGNNYVDGSIQYLKTWAKLCPKTVIGERLSVSAFDRNPKDATKVTVPNGDVTAWIRRLGFSR